MKHGYVLVHRAAFDHRLLDDGPYCRRSAWLWLIANSAFEPCRVTVEGMEVQLGRGQCSYSDRFLGRAWGWERTKVRRFLKALEKAGMIRREVPPPPSAPSPHTRGQQVLTVENYDHYQAGNLSRATPRTEAPPKNINQSKDIPYGRGGAPVGLTIRKVLFDRAVEFLMKHGTAQKNARTLVGGWIKSAKAWAGDKADLEVIAAIDAAMREEPAEPVAWITARLKRMSPNPRPGRQACLI